jgi:hypothetical protein
MTVTKPRVFVSHTTRDYRDLQQARRLAAGLQALGADVFIAPDSIPVGQNWHQRLVEEILDRCSHLLVLATAASLASARVCEEIQLAEKKLAVSPLFKLIPIRIGPYPDTPEGRFLKTFQHIDLRSDSDAAEVIEQVGRALGLELVDADYYLAAEVAQKTEHFVGRQQVFGYLDGFFKGRRRGVLSLVGEPGAGKSAFLAELVRRNRCYLAFFASRGSGCNRPEDFIASLTHQLRIQGLLPPEISARYQAPGSGAANGNRPQVLLQEAIRALPADAPDLILVVDGLDEVDQVDPGNTLFLPENPLDRLKIVVSRRNDAAVRMLVKSDFQEKPLSDFADEARQDIEALVRHRIYTGPLRERLRGTDQETFVAVLCDKSDLNFMYVHHAFAEAEHRAGDLDVGASLLEALVRMPQGLQPYYEDHWRRMGMMDSPSSAQAKMERKVIYLLSQSPEPMSREWLVAVLRRGGARVDNQDVQDCLDHWSAFLRRTRVADGTRVYRFYHDSFRIFLQRQDIIEAAGVDLRELSQNWLDQFEDEYGREPRPL